MKVAIIGASGFVGSRTLKEALNRDHHVTAIVRHPERIADRHENLEVKKGNALDAQSLTPLLKGIDAVISTYNPGWENPRIYEEFLQGAGIIQQSVKDAGIKRFLLVGGAGSLYVAPGVQLVDTPEFPKEYKQGALAARDYLNVLKQDDVLEWTYLSPAILMHPGITTGRTGKYRTGTEEPVKDKSGESKISAEDLSVAILDEIENGRFIRKRFTVAY
jgi:putative NADH-flavin reductase